MYTKRKKTNRPTLEQAELEKEKKYRDVLEKYLLVSKTYLAR